MAVPASGVQVATTSAAGSFSRQTPPQATALLQPASPWQSVRICLQSLGEAAPVAAHMALAQSLASASPQAEIEGISASATPQ